MGVRYATESGWINTDAFYAWLKNLFVPNLPAIRPVLLVFDGHTSHLDLQAGRYCKDNGIELLCLPPHTTHTSQPLDKGVFGPAKKEWKKLCTEFYQQHPGTAVDKFTFGRIFTKMYLKTFTKENCISAFKSTGIWPVNPEAIDYSKMDSSKSFPIEIDSIPESTSASMPMEQVDIQIEAEPTVPDESVAPETTDSISVISSTAYPTLDKNYQSSASVINVDDISDATSQKRSVSTIASKTVLKSSSKINHLVVSVPVSPVLQQSVPGCSKDVDFFTSTPITTSSIRIVKQQLHLKP